ncbi:MAG: methionyl-tRNA formyltransferase [Candidatus Krumholzibacteria bacterium]|jgi:methionyl-tRNA formyltransferase|nr:methionyl-tRNA formyltransferase [Candidatus Krumholzibacteria bacterium]MDP6669642.1 methionyl-tRNA formyltransferase [Candidatus Krumholzibacteria bacterium]MDP7021068.1 methionyl-tRNA formyltransferase [Candidatus Krumholzibacteria bacterium]
MDSLRIVFLGTPELAIPCLEVLHGAQDVDLRLVVTPGDRRRGRGRAASPTPVGQRAGELGLPLLKWERGDRLSVEKAVRAEAPDLVIVLAFSRILKSTFLEIPRLACLNLHASLLPWGRGASPIQQAILEGLPRSGWTAMKMDEGLDTGEILEQHPLEIASRWTAGDLQEALKETSAGFLMEVLQKWRAGEIQSSPQKEEEATHCPKIPASAGAIDWNRNAVELERRIRAFDPAPGSWCRREGKRLGILNAEILSEDETTRPGEVLSASDEGLDVSCGKGVLRILHLRPEGRKAQAVADYLRGRPLAAGSILEQG